MASSIVDTNLPIVPGKGLGGIELRRNIGDYDRLLQCFPADMEWQLDFPYYAFYTLPCSIGIGVDIRNGMVSRITALAGYRGMLEGKIHVGMRFHEAYALDPQLYYDESLHEVRSRSVPGVALLPPDSDTDPKGLPSQPIVGISIFAFESGDCRGLVRGEKDSILRMACRFGWPTGLPQAKGVAQQAHVGFKESHDEPTHKHRSAYHTGPGPGRYRVAQEYRGL